jgi:hypothetical protein
MLEQVAADNPKPKKAEPDAQVLAALAESCKSFDIDEVDKAMDELERYDYESKGELVVWLRTQLTQMGFDQIVERLTHEQGKDV